MKRTAQAVTAAVVAILSAPSVALAADGSLGAESAVGVAVSLAGLVVAIVLLLEALAVRRVAFGGALAEKISFVVLAVVCLAASAIAQWAHNFVAEFTQQQMQLASQAFVIAAMGLLAAYFYSVRSALQSYLNALTGSELLAAAADPAADVEGERA